MPAAWRSLAATLAATGLAVGAPPQADRPEGNADPVPPDAVTWVPESFDVVVEVRDLARWWEDPTIRSLTSILERRMSNSDLGERWTELAAVTGLDALALVELSLGESFAFAVSFDRLSEPGSTEPSWFVSMRIDEAARHDLLARLPLRPLGRGRHELRGHGLIVLDSPPHLVAGTPRAVEAVANSIGIPRAEIDRPEISLEIRSGLDLAPLRMTAAFEGSAIAVRGVQPRSPLSASATLRLDPRLRETLAELRRSHAAVVASVAGGPSPIGLEWIAVVPELAVPPSLGRCALARRVWTVGETCGDAGDPLRHHPTPAIAAAFEVRDAAEAKTRLAAWADTLAAAIGRRLEGLAMPPIDAVRTVDGGTLPMAAAARTLLGGHALLERVRVDWTAASGPSGQWAIVGTGASYLRDVRHAFEPALPIAAESEPEGPEADSDADAESSPWRLVQVGWIDGSQVSGHLDGWCRRGVGLFERGTGERLRRRLGRMLEISNSIDHLQWSIEEGASGERRFEIRLEPATAP